MRKNWTFPKNQTRFRLNTRIHSRKNGRAWFYDLGPRSVHVESTCESKFAVTLCKFVPCQHMSSFRLSLFLWAYFVFYTQGETRRSVCCKIVNKKKTVEKNCGKLEKSGKYIGGISKKLQNMLPIKIFEEKILEFMRRLFSNQKFVDAFGGFSMFSDVTPEMCHKNRLRWGENMICIKIFDFMGFLWQTFGLPGIEGGWR